MLAYCYCYVSACRHFTLCKSVFLIAVALRMGGLTRGKTLQRRRGAAGGLYVFYYECYVARVEGVYLSGGVGEVMTHYVGRSVEGDEGVVVKVYCFARC